MPTETVATSTCTSCGECKPASEFYRDKKCYKNHGLQYHCKSCVKSERRTYYDANTEAVNNRVRAYQVRNPGRHGTRNSMTPEQLKAEARLNHALTAGTITKPDRCTNCGKVGRLHGHHWHGYDDPLDVIWLCPSCHHAAHGRGPRAR